MAKGKENGVRVENKAPSPPAPLPLTRERGAKNVPSASAALAPTRERGVKVGRPEAPYWLPSGVSWDRLPEGLKHAAVEILEPAYRRLVLEAASELERMASSRLARFTR